MPSPNESPLAPARPYTRPERDSMIAELRLHTS
jgi:hypothetical protein